MRGTTYILEYIYDEDTEWRFESEYEYVSDAQIALAKHVETYNFIKARVRRVKQVTEESIVGQYNPIVVEDLA